MPGSVANASISDVFPKSLSSAFTEVRESAPIRIATYHDGSTDRSKLANSNRRRFVLTQVLNPADLASLKDFYDAHPLQAFYFYNPYEPFGTNKTGSNFDGTGASLTGRYSVRFASSWEQSSDIELSNVGCELIEVA